MTVTLNDPEVDKLARELSARTGETVTQAVLNALRECLERETGKQNHHQTSVPTNLKEELLRIGRECAALPVLDNRTSEEILGYDEVGITC